MFCWNKYKTGDIRKYMINGELMQMSDEVHDFLVNHNEEFKKNCNGVGSQVGFWNKLIYHIIPDSIIGLNITGESDLHDNGYAVPREFNSLEAAYEYFQQQNWYFLSNLKNRILANGGWDWVVRRRMKRAEIYYYLVQSKTGWISFMDGKIIDGFPPTDKEVEDFYNYKNPSKEE